jgi:hypothetical protein
MITVNLTRLQFFALQSLVLDRLMSKEADETQEWISVWEVPNQILTTADLMTALQQGVGGMS